MPGGVVCALDHSSHATGVAAAAADVAGQLGLRLVLADADDDRPDRAEAFLEGVAQAAGLHGAELHVETGDAGSAVLALAAREDAELIVVGRSDRSWQELVLRSDCPVLVVPESG
jgi:nucleotide-binding universal stress UspA family protein